MKYKCGWAARVLLFIKDAEPLNIEKKFQEQSHLNPFFHFLNKFTLKNIEKV